MHQSLNHMLFVHLAPLSYIANYFTKVHSSKELPLHFPHWDHISNCIRCYLEWITTHKNLHVFAFGFTTPCYIRQFFFMSNSIFYAHALRISFIISSLQCNNIKPQGPMKIVLLTDCKRFRLPYRYL